MAASYVLSQMTVLLNAHDAERLRTSGHVCLADLVRVEAQAVVKMSDNEWQVIGLVTSPRSMQIVVDSHDSPRVRRNPTVRLDDLLSMGQIADRTKRRKQSIRKWNAHADWPKPIRTIGRQPIWYWPDVAAFMRRHGWPIRKETE